MNWDVITQDVVTGVNAIAPIISALEPAAAPAVAIILKIIQGAAAAEPTALALVKQIQSGVPPTADQLAQYYANYKADDDALAADIAARLKA